MSPRSLAARLIPRAAVEARPTVPTLPTFRPNSAPNTVAPIGLGDVVIGILEQALENVAQHAGAAVVRLGFSSLNDELRVVVVDDGVGFEFGDKAGGFGLTAMRESAEAVGGELVIESRSGGGTRVNIVLPFARP